jgi:HAD superfamily hydrolase (TIGR01490 family)
MTSKRTIAIFDLDNTLLEGDTDTLWGEFLYQKGVMDLAFVRKVRKFYRDHQEATMDIQAYADCLLSPLKTHPLRKMEALREEFLSRTDRRIRPAMLKRVNWHRTKKHVLIMITNSHGFITEPIGQLLGFSARICTQAEFKDGGYTGKLSGIPAYGDGKILRLSAWLQEHRLSLDHSWAYSDSFTDLPLLSMVENPVAVTPDAQLRRHALEHNWRLMEFERGGPAGLMRMRIASG